MVESCLSIVEGCCAGPVLSSSEALSFWGGVDPASGAVIDHFHPLNGRALSGSVLVLPTSRGSCSGSGVLLDMILNNRAPAALVFSEEESVLTLGALVALEMFDRNLPVLRLSRGAFAAAMHARWVEVTDEAIRIDSESFPTSLPDMRVLRLSTSDEATQKGDSGPAAAQAMSIICKMALQQGAETLIDVTRAHIDGCLYASPANLVFAERMADLGGRVVVPTTMNAISVDHSNWRKQGVPEEFGVPAQRLADSYVRMGCRPTFTCAPYLLDDQPEPGEAIAWAESNAVIYANSVLGARTPKHADFLDLCIALTGRAPHTGVYLDAGRRAQIVISVEVPRQPDDAFWPLIGYLSGKAARDRIPYIDGLAHLNPGIDELKALCAAFGTTGASPMLHIAGVTPEASGNTLSNSLPRLVITHGDLEAEWQVLNSGSSDVDLVAIGSPHASLGDVEALVGALAAYPLRQVKVPLILTIGRDVLAITTARGWLNTLESAGVTVIPDICWCSITKPVFPSAARVVLTNSGKYAHYGPGLSDCQVRLGTLQDCVNGAMTGSVQPRPFKPRR